MKENYMKKIFTTIFALVFCFVVTSAEDDYGVDSKPASIKFGPYFGWSVAGINASEVPTGTKNAVATSPSPNFGLMAYYPTDYTKNSGFGGTIGFKQIPYAFDVTGYKTGYNYSYFIVGALFNVSGFTLGLDASFPTKASIIDNDVELNSDNMSTVIDLKLGGLFKIQENSFGSTNIFITLGYFLGEQYKTAPGINGTPAHAEIGLTYLLDTANW
jgi:hypothetical protein